MEPYEMPPSPLAYPRVFTVVGICAPPPPFRFLVEALLVLEECWHAAGVRLAGSRD